MKKIVKLIASALSLCLLLSLCVGLVGCGKEEKTMQEEFAEYLGLDSQYGGIQLQSGITPHIFFFEKENGYAPRVWLCLDAGSVDDGKLYSWLTSSVDKKKSDLKGVGDKVVAFANSKNWNNNYYLYISLSYDSEVETIYDYEKEKLYVPNCDHYYLEMYEKFGSCNDYTIKDMTGGADWLVSKGLGEYKHDKFELFYSNSPLVSMTIWCKDGKFSIRDTKKSTEF